MADTKISAMPAATALTGAELLAGVQSAANVKVTSDQQKTWALTGTATNNNAAAGAIGELISSTVLIGSAVSITSNTDTNITSISLTAGDWDVWGVIDTNPAGGTTTTFFQGWISATSATAPTRPNNGASFILRNSTGIAGAGENLELPVNTTRISLASTTTIYLGAKIVFASSTMTAYGFIGARRRR